MSFSLKNRLLLRVLSTVLLLFPLCSYSQEIEETAEPSDVTPIYRPILPQVPGAPLDVHLIDINGKLSPAFINYPYESFDVSNLLTSSQVDEPEYQIQSIETTGKVHRDLAELSIRYRIDIRNGSSIRVPLGLPEGFFLHPADTTEQLDQSQYFHYEGPGNCRLTRQLDNGEYVAFIHSTQTENSPGEKNPTQISGFVTHFITLRLAFPVTELGTNEFRLKAGFPRSFSSMLKLEVPIPDAVANVSQGTSPIHTIPIDEKVTQFSIQGLHKDFDLRWHSAKHTLDEEKLVLQVEDLSIHIDLTPHAALFDAVIPVSSTSGAFETVHIVLPKYAEWIEETTPTNYSIREVALPEITDSKCLEVTFPEKISDKTNIHLKAITSDNPDSEWFELGGFRVLNAEKQYGKIEVAVSKDHRLDQKEIQGVRLTDFTTSSEIDGTLSEFEVFLQPCSLKAKATQRYTKLTVRPEYQIQIDRNQAVLKARFSYTIQGVPVNQLTLDPAGWESLHPTQNSTLIDEDLMVPALDGTYPIPLRMAVEKSIDLEITAYQKINPNNPVIQLRFPKPVFPKLVADRIEPGIVTIYPADNIELNPNPAVSPLFGISRKPRRSVSLHLPAPPRQQEPLVYQIDNMDNAVFSAELIPHEQQIQVEMQGDFRLLTEPESQTYYLKYTVNYEPVDRLIFAVPKELDERGPWVFSIDNQTFTSFVISPPEGYTANDKTVFRRISLPESRIGTFTLTARQTGQAIATDRTKLQPERTFPTPLHLLLPLNGTLSRELITVTVPRGIQINLVDEKNSDWKKNPEDNTVVSQFLSYHFETQTPSPVLPMAIYLDDHDSLGSTIVDRCWIQTWITGTSRRDRASYLVISDLNVINITLPDNVHPSNWQVKLNGQPIPATIAENQLQIALSAGRTKKTTSQTDKTPLLVEVYYEVDMSDSRNSVTLALPRFEPEVWVRSVYWQLILPSHRHLIFFDRNWIPQYRWNFENYHFARVPLLDQDGLTEWIGHGLAPLEPLSTATNSYLLSALHPTVECRLHIVDRSTLVLISSGFTLLIGLLFIYFKKIRYPGILFTLAVLLVSALIHQPVLTILFMQAGCIGVVLSLLAMVLYRLFSTGEAWNDVPYTDLTTYGVKPDENQSSQVYPTVSLKRTTEELTSLKQGSTDQIPSSPEDTP